MKKISIALAILISATTVYGFAATGTIETKMSPNRENTLDVTIEGPVAKQISDHLTGNGVEMRREPFSGTLVQVGQGIRCINEDGERPLYCYIAIVGPVIK